VRSSPDAAVCCPCAGALFALQMNAVAMLRKIHHEEGMGRLFSGIVPRVFWISVGGFVFFGSFEAVKGLIHTSLFKLA
jgi:hypothetical protein